MKSLLLLLVLSLFALVSAQYWPTTYPEYESNCPKCVTALNGTLYYCTKNHTCSNQTIDNFSCEQGIATCLNYVSVDLGLKEIPPFTTVKSSFNYSLRNNQSVKFAISNQDSKTKAWFKIMIKNGLVVNENGDTVSYMESATDHTEISDMKHSILESSPSGVFVSYFD